MVKKMTCQDCGKAFSANTESVNEVGMVLDIQCTCGSWEVDITKGEVVEQILPKHLREEKGEDLFKKLDALYEKYNKVCNELIELNQKQIECTNNLIYLSCLELLASNNTTKRV